MTFIRYRWLAGLVGLMVTLSLAGCITIGQDFRSEAVDLVKPGQTTDEEVLKIFGNPVRTGIADDGLREWTYARYHANIFGRFEGRDLVVKFDENGRVKTLSYNTTDPKDKRVMAR
jgi:outer membrane protein assembly factor BamE (lipoprotein component of BamABCDE complex)